MLSYSSEIDRFLSEGTKYRLVGGNTATGIYDDGPYDAFIDVKQVNELKKCSRGKFFYYDRNTTYFTTKFHVREDFFVFIYFYQAPVPPSRLVRPRCGSYKSKTFSL